MKPVSSAASVRQRLLNHAKNQGEPFDFVLVRYGIERFLYRLGVSRWAVQFVLKGSMLFHAWRHTGYRPTRDVDLLDLAGDGGTALPTGIPAGLTPAFAEERQTMWQAFLSKNGLQDRARALRETIASIAARLPADWNHRESA